MLYLLQTMIEGTTTGREERHSAGRDDDASLPMRRQPGHQQQQQEEEQPPQQRRPQHLLSLSGSSHSAPPRSSPRRRTPQSSPRPSPPRRPMEARRLSRRMSDLYETPQRRHTDTDELLVNETVHVDYSRGRKGGDPSPSPTATVVTATPPSRASSHSTGSRAVHRHSLPTSNSAEAATMLKLKMSERQKSLQSYDLADLEATPPMCNKKNLEIQRSHVREQLMRHQVFHSDQQQQPSKEGPRQSPRNSLPFQEHEHHDHVMHEVNDESEHDTDDEDDHTDHEVEDYDGDDGSLSLHSECSDEQYFSDITNDHNPSLSSWTLQSFMDHQLHASYLNNGEGLRNSLKGKKSHRTSSGKTSSSTRRKRGKGVKRQLSLHSATSNNVGDSPGNDTLTTTEDIMAASPGPVAKVIVQAVASPTKRAVSALTNSTSALTTSTAGEFLSKRRQILPKLICATLLFVNIAFFISTSNVSILNLKRGGEKAQTRQRRAMENNDQEMDDWHPLFQHSHRTADVEVEVPSTPTKAMQAKKDTASIGGTPKKQGLDGTGSKGLGSSHRRDQETGSVLFSNAPREGSTLFTNAGDGTRQAEDETSPDDGDDGATFIPGEVVQELCPATHTLISQSLILRSSYGNIFSITTPDSPVKKKKRDSGGHSSGVHMGEEYEDLDADDSSHREAEAVGEEVDNIFFRRNLQGNNDPDSGGSYADTGDYNDIDTATESIYDGTGVETITIRTLSLRMADYRPEEGNHFEVWVYTGSGDNIPLNENDLDNDPTNDNLVIPSKGNYQTSRAKFAEWQLIAEGDEADLVPDTDFFDHNGHIFNIGAGTTIGPLGRLNEYENMEDVTIAAQEWNKGKVRPDGGMDAITAEGEVTTTFFYKIPEERFTQMKLPKYNGKLTLFVTLDRVGLQYGYAAKREFDKVDVNKHDYIDQTPSLDVLNGNVDLRMHVGEGVIFYPWMEEEFFYNTRRFLGKIWYDAKIPCEYTLDAELLDDPESTAPSMANTQKPSMMPSMAPSFNGTAVAADVLVSVLIRDGPLPPMPDDVKEIFEKTVLDFVKDEYGDFCPLTWNEGATVTDQETAPLGGLATGSSTSTERRKRDGSGHATSSRRKPDPHPSEGSGTRYLRQLLEPIFSPPPPKPSRERLLQAITVLDAQTVFDALYNSNSCPNKSPNEWANLIETFINDNKEDLLDKLKASHDYFEDAFGVSADAVLSEEETIVAAVEEEEDKPPIGAIVGGIIAALILCCFCCCLPFLIVRRRKRREEKENEIIGEDIEWAHPVDEDHFPPLGGYRGDTEHASGDGSGEAEEVSKMRKRPDGEVPENDETGPSIQLNPIPPGLRPPEDDTEMVHGTKWLDKPPPEDKKKQRPFGLPGRMPDDGTEPEPYNINIYPGGDYEDTEDGGEGIDLNHIEKEKTEKEEEDWKPDHYEPDGGVHSYERGSKSVSINASWNRLPQKEEKVPSPKKKLSIKELVLQRKKDLEAKMMELKHVEQLEAGTPPEDEAQVFPKPEPDSRIEDLMTRIKDLEKDRTQKYQKQPKEEGETDYEIWRRLNIGDDSLSSSSESSDDEVQLRAVVAKKKKKKKKGDDYMLKFDDLDAYNRALAVHQDAYIHKWVKVKVEKGEGDEDEEGEMGAALDDLEMVGPPPPMEGEDAGVEVDGKGRARPDMSRMKTEYLGDMDLGDISSDDSDGDSDSDSDSDDEAGAASAAAAAAAAARPNRRAQMSKQKTEYIGSLRGLDEDEEDEPPPQGARARPDMSRMKTEYLGDMDLGDIDSDDDAGAAAAAAAKPDRRAQMSRMKTEYIGSLRDMGEDEDEEPPPQADRRSMMSKQKTEYIGSISNLDSVDTASGGGSKRSSLKAAPTASSLAAGRRKSSRKSGVSFGAISEAGEEGGKQPPPRDTDRRSMMSKQKTEYIGDIGEEEDE